MVELVHKDVIAFRCTGLGPQIIPASNSNSSPIHLRPFFPPRNSSFLLSPSHSKSTTTPSRLATHSFHFLPIPNPFINTFTSGMSLSHIPLPSIALVLASDRPSLPSRPSVIKVEFDPLQTIHPTSPGPGRVLVCRHPVSFCSS